MENIKYTHLSESDVKILKENFVLPQKNGKLDTKAQAEELDQIDRFYSHIEITINGKKSTMARARELLDQTTFLGALDRAVFHSSATREGKNKEEISFDSSKYWSKINEQVDNIR